MQLLSVFVGYIEIWLFNDAPGIVDDLKCFKGKPAARSWDLRNCVKFWFWDWYKVPNRDHSSVDQARRSTQLTTLIRLPCFSIGYILLLLGCQAERWQPGVVRTPGLPSWGTCVTRQGTISSPRLSSHPLPTSSPSFLRRPPFPVTRRWREVQLHLPAGRCPIGIQQPFMLMMRWGEVMRDGERSGRQADVSLVCVCVCVRILSHKGERCGTGPATMLLVCRVPRLF